MPKSIGCGTQEEWEGRTELGSRNIQREKSEIEGGGEGRRVVGGIVRRGVIVNIATTGGNKRRE